MYWWSSVPSIYVSVHKTVLRNYVEVCYGIEYENVGKK